MVEFWHAGNMLDDAGALAPKFLTNAAKVFRRWRHEEFTEGRVLTLGAMAEECQRRWPLLSFRQACAVVAAADQLATPLTAGPVARRGRACRRG